MQTLSVVCLLLPLVAVVSAQGGRARSLCMDQNTCGACIVASSQCSWCKQKVFEHERCNLEKVLIDEGCANTEVISPNHTMDITKNESANSEKIQLTPQEVTIKLRPNRPYKLAVTFRQAENYPVDLYYLMDLSVSMEDDKKKLAELGRDLADKMKKITNNFRLGFGSFVDKKVMPYVSTVPKDLVSPCDNCSAPYGFKNQLRLDNDSKLFADQVEAANISGNLDSPEGGFDAIMQSIVCDSEIGWRNSSRKILLFSTDAGFHSAGDGKLGGIVKPNDGTCHMDSEGFYTESLHQDYPSISHVAQKAQKKNMNIIFAVTANQVDQYEELAKFIESSMVGELANDSSNIVELVKKNYQKISSKIKLEKQGLEDKDNMFVSIRSKCGDGKWKVTDSCEDLRVGKSISFEVSIEAKSCPELAKDRDGFFELYPVGLTETLKINYELICDCPCEHPGVEERNSPHCNMTGTYECGACTCNTDHYGKFCQCDGSSLTTDDYDAACKKTNTSKVCQGKGDCVCGLCDCYTIGTGSGSDPSIKYKGKFCDCNDYSCDNYQGLMCGGPERGVCSCGQCLCNPDYTGNDCSCPLRQDTCMAANGKECNGVGKCHCGSCICNRNTGFRGPTCEDCRGCEGKCSLHKACAMCVGFETGTLSPEDCLANCSHATKVSEIDRSDEAKRKVCRFRDDEDKCFFSFTYEYETDKVEVQEMKDCPTPINILAIILGIIFAILLIGLALLLIWKLLATVHDKRELAKFEKERNSARWEMGENPIYKQATSTYKNPTYRE